MLPSFEDLANSAHSVIAEYFNAPPFYDEPKFINLTSLLNGPDGHVVDSEVNIGRAGGASFDRERAFAKLFGESVERFCLLGPTPTNRHLLSFEELTKKGEHALNPNLVVAGMKRRPPDRQGIPFAWLSGQNASSGESIFVPQQLVDMPYAMTKSEALLRVSITTGAACGINKSDAIARGYCELVERDAFMLSWLTSSGLKPLELTESFVAASPHFSKAYNEIRKYGLNPILFQMKNDADLPCVLCVLEDELSDIVPFSLGAKCAPSFGTAILGALEEAVQLRHWLRTISPGGSKRYVAPDTLKDRGLMTKTENYCNHLKSWMKESSSKETLRLTDGDEGSYEALHLPENLVFVDLTRRLPDKAEEWRVSIVKCIIPDLQPLYLTESLPDFAWNRIEKRTSDPLNPIPHPFLLRLLCRQNFLKTPLVKSVTFIVRVLLR